MSKVKFIVGVALGSLLLCGLSSLHYQLVSKSLVLNPSHQYFGAILPHHLLAKDFIDDFFSKLNHPPQKIYIVGPNHSEIGNSLIITNTNSESNDLTSLKTVQVNDQIISQEHSVKVFQDILIGIYPKTLVIPIIISSNLSFSDIEQLSDYLAKNTTDNTLIICSTDFSHYRSLSEANAFDEITIDMIVQKKYSEIFKLDNNYIDSGKSLLVLLKTLDKTGKNKLTIINHNNSAIINNDLHSPSTTSYFEVVFE